MTPKSIRNQHTTQYMFLTFSPSFPLFLPPPFISSPPSPPISSPSLSFLLPPIPCIGTGKTATFAVGILQRLDVEVKQCQALVLAPTRELAQQIVKVIGALGDFMNLKIHACVGGTAVRDDIRTLQDGVHIVVGTPGRVYDMIQRRALRLDSVQLFGTYTNIHFPYLQCH